MRSRKRDRHSGQRRWLLVIGALLLCGGLFSLVGNPQELRTPAGAIADALPQLGAKDSGEETTSLLEYAATEPLISHWALLLQGSHYEARELSDQAVATYKQIPNDSAASLDAKVAVLRIAGPPAQSPEAAAEFGKFMNELEQDVRAARRSDLLPELQLIRARAAEADGDFNMALTMYRQIRRDFAGREVAERAKIAFDRLEAKAGAALPPRSIPELLEEARLLLKENQATAALEQVQLAKLRTTQNAPAYFEVQLQEEDVLRRMGRREEADRLLSMISADAPDETASQALLKLVKNAWNANQQDRALELSASFQKRFPRSRLYEELLYIKSRVLEEKGRLADAKESYLALAGRSGGTAAKVKALRHIAWLHLRKNELASAAEFFEQARVAGAQLFEEQLADASGSGAGGKSVRESRDEYTHAVFWLAYCLKKLDQDGQKKLSFKPPEVPQLVREIAKTDPYHYYGYLAEELLGEPLPTQPVVVTADLRERCSTPVPQRVIDTARLLAGAQLTDFTRFEIDWHFSKRRRPAAQVQEHGLEQEITRARLYSDHALTNRGIGFAEELLRTAQYASGYPADAVERCTPVLFELSFPLPYLDLFRDAAARMQLSAEILLAVARTESHFDPLAVSPRNAAGLLQLLPKTAEEEGLKPEDNLFDPAVNIRLGAKHLARVLKMHKGEEHLAIAAYNAGPTPVQRWVNRHPELAPERFIELIGYPETKNYVKEVLRARYFYLKRLKAAQEAAAR